MPRARDNAAPGSSRIPIPRTFGPSRGSVPIAAMIAQQQEQQAQFSKLLATMQKAEEANQLQVAAAAQAGGGAATKIANQVAAGIKEQKQVSRRQQERAEDKAFAVDQQRLNAELQAAAAKEAALMGAKLSASRDTMRFAVDAYKAKKASFAEIIAGVDARVDEMVHAGHFNSKEGRQRYKKIRNVIRMAKDFGDDQFDDRHIAEMLRLHNRNIESIIEGDDPQDITNLVVDPMLMPMVDLPHKSGKRIAEEGEISPDKRFEMKLFGGYPKDGVLFTTEENFGMPREYVPKLINARTVMNALGDDLAGQLVTDKSLRDELRLKTANLLVQATDRLQPHQDMYGTFNKVFEAAAGAAVQRSLENFLANPNPNKFSNMPRQILFGALAEVFGGGKKGEEIAVIAAEIFDGKRELKSNKELAMAMGLESALFNIRGHLETEFQSIGEGGESLAGTLVDQMERELGPEETARALGVPSNAVGLVKGRDVMMGRLAEVVALANRAHTGFEKNSLLEQFTEELSSFARKRDIFAFRILNEGEENERRVQELMSPEDIRSTAAERVAATPSGELEGSLTRVDAADIQAVTSSMEAVTGIASELGFDIMGSLATMITNELEPNTTANLSAYLAQTRVERERSGYSRNSIEGASFNYQRQQRAKKARLAKSTVGESFEKGGVVGIVLEQAPAMLGIAARGGQIAVEQTFKGVVHGVAGREAGEGALNLFRQGQEVLGRGIARAASPATGADTNLTKQEQEQILRGGP